MKSDSELDSDSDLDLDSEVESKYDAKLMTKLEKSGSDSEWDIKSWYTTKKCYIYNFENGLTGLVAESVKSVV